MKVYLLFLICFSIISFGFTPGEDWERAVTQDLEEIYTKAAQNSLSGVYFYTQEHSKNKVFGLVDKENINLELKSLDAAGRLTILYVAFGFIQRKTTGTMSEAEAKTYAAEYKTRLENVTTTLKTKNIETDYLNLHISLIMLVKNVTDAKVKNPVNKLWDFELNMDEFKPRSDMSDTCSRQIKTALAQAVLQKTEGAISKGPNKAMLWRAKLLKEKLMNCPTIPIITTNPQQNILSILAHIKEKAEKNQKVIVHTTPENKPVNAEINATDITIGTTKYARIRYKNFANVNPSFSDPLTYRIVTDDKAKPKTASFLFYNTAKPDTMLFSISIFDDKNKERKDSLQRYLFGDRNEVFLKDVKWISQLDEATFGNETCFPDIACCNKACNWILDKSSVSTSRPKQKLLAQSSSDDCNSLSKHSEFQTALDILEKSIKDHKKPMLIGINHPKCKINPATKAYELVKSCSRNTPNITNHYIVAVGFGYDVSQKKKYIRFYDVGTNDALKAKSELNRLYINAESVIGKTQYSLTTKCGDYTYTLTEVRQNDGYEY